MKLTEIDIISFRSIVNQKIQINNSCIGLIGLNESGKTNILNAIRTLDNDFEMSIKDRSKINNELPNVKFLFTFESEEILRIKNYLNVYLSKLTLLPTANIIKNISLTTFSIRRFILLEENDYKLKKLTENDLDLEIAPNFMKSKYGVKIPPELTIKLDDKEYHLNNLSFIKRDLLTEETIKYYEPLTVSFMKIYIKNRINEYIVDSIPSVVYWEFKDKYLLPSEITYDAFLDGNSAYNNSAPLYNIFMLSKRLNILNDDKLKIKIAEWKTDSSIRRRDSSILNEDINRYIKGIWVEYDQELNIELEESKITIHINDPKSTIKNYYELETRSQGFKTFISFILNIAAEADCSLIENFILVLDEPETHLHPSGVRFMKNEILKLSESNYVFYATHSIFMVDRINLKRHLIIKKHNEQTSLKVVDRNNIIQESVIYEALGTTIDEFSISSKNIVFEGESDLLLFQKYIELCIPKKVNTLEDYELLDGDGTKSIKTFFKSKVIPKESEWILILDSDSPGKKLEEEILNVYSSIKDNLTFVFYSDEENVELEDLLPEELIQNVINEVEVKLKLEIYQKLNLTKQSNTKSLAEYKGRNNISDRLFEKTFKEILINKITNELSKITKSSNFQTKNEQFKKYFPKYYEFATNFVKEYNK